MLHHTKMKCMLYCSKFCIISYVYQKHSMKVELLTKFYRSSNLLSSDLILSVLKFNH